MPISEAKIREMRENSARKYAEQLRREEQQAKNYANERKKNMAKMMSVNEKIELVARGKNEGLSINQIVEKYGIPRSSVLRYLREAKERGLIKSGVVDAAELSEAERAELTAQVEADAGITCDGSGESTTDEPKPADISDIYDVARNILGAMRLAHIPDGADVSVRIIGNTCKTDITCNDMTLSSSMKWRT